MLWGTSAAKLVRPPRRPPGGQLATSRVHVRRPPLAMRFRLKNRALQSGGGHKAPRQVTLFYTNGKRALDDHDRRSFHQVPLDIDPLHAMAKVILA